MTSVLRDSDATQINMYSTANGLKNENTIQLENTPSLGSYFSKQVND